MAASGSPLMNLRSKLLPALAFVVSVALTSCGTATAPISTAGLNGNWNLAGDRALGQYPLLSTTLAVNGNQITGEGDVAYQCPPGNVGFGVSVLLNGLIASDGTFHLVEPSFPSSLPPPSIQVTVDGSVPARGGTAWSGSYTITPLASVGCDGVAHTDSFTATAFAPINATYSGKIVGMTFGSGSNVSMQIAQGAPKTVQRANGTSITLYPLSGTISVQGSSCFKHGTTTGSTFPNYVAGDFVSLSFVMDDGSQLLTSGWLSDTSEKNLEVAMVVTPGAACKSNFGSGNLTAQ